MKQQNRIRYMLYLLLLVHVGCITPKFSNKTRRPFYSAVPTPERPKTFIAETPEPKVTTTVEPESREPTRSEFFSKILQPNYKLSEEDQAYIEQLNQHSLDPTSLATAISIIGLFKTCLNQVENNEPNTMFLEEDLQTEEMRLNATPTENECLSSQVSRVPVDMRTALSENSYLRSHATFLIFNDVATLAGSSNPLREQLLDHIHREERKWLDLISAKQRLNQQKPQAEIPNLEKKPQVAPPLEFSALESETGFAIIDKAQDLIDQNRFQDAIRLLKRVKEDEMIFSEASAKVKEASNLAISNLRKQAAKSFQNAITIRDPQAKQNYLEEAQKMLRIAVTQFPLADQIGTVRENLKIIEQNIASLSQQLTPND